MVSVASAQPAASSVDSRYLLIFDTSSAMKSRVPATQYVVERLFFSMMNGQFQPGDSIGVWAFDRKLRTGAISAAALAAAKRGDDRGRISPTL